MSRKNLPPLEVGTGYRAQDFERFEFFGRALRGPLEGEDIAILRLHLSNGTTLDIPAEDEKLLYLTRVLVSAFPQETIAFLKTMPWFRASSESPE